MLKMYIESEM